MRPTQLANVLHDILTHAAKCDGGETRYANPATGLYSDHIDRSHIMTSVTSTTQIFTSVPSVPMIRQWIVSVFLPAANVVQTNHREHASGGGYALLVPDRIRIKAGKTLGGSLMLSVIKPLSER